MDWSRFQFDYRLRYPALQLGLHRIDVSKESLLDLTLPPHWREQLDRLNRVRAVHGTTVLEGNPLSERSRSSWMSSLHSALMALPPS